MQLPTGLADGALGAGPARPADDAYGCFGVLYSTSFWNRSQTVS